MGFEYYIGTLAEPLEQGQHYFFHMEFVGHLNDELRGFYRSVYTNDKAEQV